MPKENLNPPTRFYWCGVVPLQPNLSLREQTENLARQMHDQTLREWTREAYRRSRPGRNADWWLRKWLRLP